MNLLDETPSEFESNEPVETKMTEERPEKGKREMSDAFQKFNEQVTALPTPEEKVACGLQFMRSSISQEGSPRFREFWEARRQVLPFFRDNINPAIRSKLWEEYVELTVEARRLKEILEEQSSFAMEQIDLAIAAIESDLTNQATLLAQAHRIGFPENCQTIAQKSDVYNRIQRELNLLNTLASRLNGLRKEVIKTDMRIRFKTKFFKRLSELGDNIFPKRKELIEAISAEFEKDVEAFVAHHFQGDQVVGAPYYALREEIKALQGMAKLLTLSSPVFSRTRLKLSECWDKIKVLEKEYKKEVVQKKQASSENRQPIQVKIDELAAKSPQLSLKELDAEIDAIFEAMRSVDLQRDDVRYLRDELFKLRAPHIASQEQKQRDLEQAEKDKIRLKREKVAQIKERIAQLIREGEQMELEALLAAQQEVIQDIEQLEVSKIEKQPLERSLRPLKDIVADKKESSMLNLSDDEKQALENLRSVLDQKKQRRQEIKVQLETYRKSLGGSGLDFEKAMLVREQIEQEKERLEKANDAIGEIEAKIAELEEG